jgi:hypothetical protein
MMIVRNKSKAAGLTLKILKALRKLTNLKIIDWLKKKNVYSLVND